MVVIYKVHVIKIQRYCVSACILYRRFILLESQRVWKQFNANQAALCAYLSTAVQFELKLNLL